MHCRSPDSIVGKHLGLFHTAEQLRYGGEVDLRELEAGNPVTAAVGHVRRDGSTFCTAMTTSPIRDAQQQLAGFVRSARDVGAGPGKPPAMNVPDNPFGAGELLAQLACVG